ncbi:cytochrome c oxidase assembly protein [Actinoplanes sp. LDG1-06]|uniref:Cytochrome c oxidase assembly protein n=1 Tax=Paractinoplanes ovalisporus TaxID=2810368 RepID=A0ABS2A5Q6_9ACTN|nr:cytochrome c oxidase assembly protein [Actinoplanes ovalisporus]MBM2615159.1 cytochrome c oxidase assembly protein [Actinoplanes ovalisporus]
MVHLAETPTLAAAGGDTVLPPFTPGVIFTEIHLGSLIALFLLVAAALYGYGVHRLRQRGDKWPVGRTVAFVVGGLGSIAAVAVTGIEAYDTTLLSVHMVQHMVLSMVGPIFLALGAPVTLALRTLPVASRKKLLAVLHSRVARVLTFPLVAFGIFVANPFVLYFTDLYRQTLLHSWLHEFIHVHFIVTGCLFFWPLLGLDPLPNRWPYPGRALLMVLSVPFHTVLGLTIMQSKTLLAGDYYPSLGLSWTDPVSDQVTAGGILWAGGEIVSVTMLGILVMQWIRQSEREARRIDRALDRQEAEEAAEAAKATEQAGPDAAKITNGAPADTGGPGSVTS